MIPSCPGITLAVEGMMPSCPGITLAVEGMMPSCPGTTLTVEGMMPVVGGDQKWLKKDVINVNLTKLNNYFMNL